MSEKIIRFLMALGTVLTSASELLRQYNQSRKYLDIEKKKVDNEPGKNDENE